MQIRLYWGNHKGLPLRINDRRGNPLWLPQMGILYWATKKDYPPFFGT